MTWEIVSGVVGILGFLLSVALWLQALFEKRIRLRLDDTTVVVMNGSNGEFLLDTMLSNKTNRNVSIYRIGLKPGAANVDINPSIHSTREYRGEKERTDINAALPIHLDPFETKRVVLFFPPDDKGKELLHSLLDQRELTDQLIATDSFAFLWFDTTQRRVKLRAGNLRLQRIHEWFQVYAS